MKKRKSTPTSPPAQPTTNMVRFHLPYLDVREAFLAGTFNEWSPGTLRLRETAEDGWEVKVALPAGEHEYLFVVDGHWIADPNNPISKPNPFGGCNSVIKVGATNPASGLR